MGCTSLGGLDVIADHIERELVIEAPVDVVWSVVTEPEQINRWFTDGAELDLRPEGQGAFSWKGFGTVVLQVERAERPHLFSFRWSHPEGQQPHAGNSTLVEFTLTDEGGNTRLRVVESGLAAIDWTDDQKSEFYDSHSSGWDRHLADLAKYIAGGRQLSVR
jgi:uncharacterized protein YndB with AHSA1/START domain